MRDTVTVRQLLTHTSGLGSYFDDRFEEKKLRIREVADYLPLIAEEKLVEALQKREDIPEPFAEKILVHNPRRLYGLQ